MQIDIKGRNTPVNDDLRHLVARRFAQIERQVSPLARLEVELSVERNPSIPDCMVAEATLFLKGATLRARDCSREMPHAINLVSDEMTRMVKRHRDKRRRRREARTPGMRPSEVTGGVSPAV